MSDPALLRRALRTRRRDLAAASALFSLHQLGEALVPVIIGATVGRAVDRGGVGAIAGWLAVLGADFLLLSMAFRFGARASVRARQHTAHQLRMWLTARVLRETGGADRLPGELLSRASSDAERAGAFAGFLARLVSAVVVLVGATVLLLLVDAVLGLTILGGTVVLLVAQSRVAALLQRRSAVEQGRQAQATALAADLIRGHRVLAGIGAEATAAASYAAASRDAVRAARHSASAQGLLGAVAALLTGLYLALVAAIGGRSALNGELGIGELVAALGLAQFVIGPMRGLSQANAAYARAVASVGRIREVLSSPDAVVAGSGTSAGPGLVELDRVRIGGVPLDVRIEAGSLTGIVCEDPATATALTGLLAREADPAAGEIRLDGRPLGSLSLADLRGRLLVSRHDTVLFPGTIGENLAALGGPVDRAVHAAFADQVLTTVAHGADTSVGDLGETLSGGQGQRIALARVLAADPPVLVLHDPTTAVDAATENLVAERVRDLRRGRTTVVVTTSPAWLSRCDQVIFEGRAGTHDDLLGERSDYAELVAR
ncbi:ABC transporter ATP-binding protein [Pseudonocardia ailaonensis]|uniref:ABC transporter ATP-binding protein n=1 Tax=Pseudonocardia ailaonensis TaxID=367279 RepID=A0ABN2NKQ1_9PSEU